MKLFPLLIAGLTLAPLPAVAGWQSGQGGWSRQCYRYVYRETYHPGTEKRPGYVRRWKEKTEVPCYNVGAEGSYYPQGDRGIPRPEYHDDYDDNSCIEGSILGGIAGGAAGAALSRDEGMIIGIPLGIVGGALVGCQIDGG